MKIYYGTVGFKDKDALKDLFRAAIKANYYGIDAAKIYGNEKEVGQALEELRSEGLDTKIQTKIWTTDFTNVRKAFEQQLKNLRVSSVHSLLLHRPSINFYESIEAWKVLIELKNEGLVEHIGVSNFENDMIRILVKETGVKPEFNQIEASLTYWRVDRHFFNQKQGIEVQGWSIFGKNAKETLKNPIVIELAEKYDTTPGAIATSFINYHHIVPIMGTSNVDRVVENIKVVSLTKEDIEKLYFLNKFENKYEESYPYPQLPDEDWK